MRPFSLSTVVAFAAFFLSALTSPTAWTAGCEQLTPPAAAGRSGWYCLRDGSLAVVFIHGLGSSNGSAWLADADGDEAASAYWPRLVAEDVRLADASVYLAGYYTALDAGDYDIERIAEDVYRDLVQVQPGKPAVMDKREIVIVAHSLGGVVARQILARHAEAFQGRRIGLLLVASPSLGSRDADGLGRIAGLLNARVVDELRWKSGTLTSLDERFRALLAEKGTRLPGFEGIELYEQHALTLEAIRSRTWLNALYQSYWGRPIVERESAAVYFDDQRLVVGSDHISIAKPRSTNDHQYASLFDLIGRVRRAKAVCRAPRGFGLEFAMLAQRPEAPVPDLSPTVVETLPRYRIERLDARGRLIGEEHLARSSGRYRLDLDARPFVCPGEEFHARLVRLPVSAAYRTEEDAPTRSCFRRAREATGSPQTGLICEEGKICLVDPERPGLAEECPEEVASLAGPALSSGSVAPYWAVPSLDTLWRLPAETRPGYTELRIRSTARPGLERADAMSYAVTVNGVSLRMDAVPPHGLRLPFNGRDGVDLVIGIENLGFTGGTDGHELIEIEMRFYQAGTAIASSRIARADYVAYRHAEAIEVSDAAGNRFLWRGFYRPASLEATVSLQLTADESLDPLVAEKAALDRRGKVFDGHGVIGVLRPGRPQDNKHPGLILGLREAGGKVRSLFSRQGAVRLCQWLAMQKDLPGWMRNPKLFEFPADIFSDEKDRGRHIGTCRNAI